MIHENLKKLIDLQNNIIILTDGTELNYANKQFFNFFKFTDLQNFKKEHKNRHHHNGCPKDKK